jgi:arginine N-succinyltransferase
MRAGLRYVIREARPGDLGAIEKLAALLDTMNLPRDRDLLAAMIETSVRSFRGEVAEAAEAEFIFVLEDRKEGKPIGTSLVIAKHGTLASPHFLMEIRTEDRHSDILSGTSGTASCGSATRPTAHGGGGLILHPDYRRLRGLGRQLSFVRFNFIARHPERFQKHVLAELLSPLDDEGKNLFWEVYGRKFTGLTYREADRLSMLDKKFILSLFPQTDLYAALLPEEVQAVLGEVAPGARAARHLLEKIGFRYLRQIDPFDGGPYFGAAMKDVTLVRDTRMLPASPGCVRREEAVTAIVSHEGESGFRAVMARVRTGDAKSSWSSKPAWRSAPPRERPWP